MSSQKRFGQRLKEAMTAKGLSNPDIAGALGVHTITVSKWRSGTQPVESHRVPRLAEVLGVTEAWLWGDGESVSEKPNVTLKKAFPAPVREYLAELRVRLVKAGADDEQIDDRSICSRRRLSLPSMLVALRSRSPTRTSWPT